MVTIGPPVVNDLEDWVVGVKIHLSRPPVSEDYKVLCKLVVPCTEMVGVVVISPPVVDDLTGRVFGM